MAPDALVTDVVSTKGAIVAARRGGQAAVRRRPPDGGPRGRRVRRGATPSCSRAAVGHRPGLDRPGTADRERVEALATACGARPGADVGRRPRRRPSPRSATCRSSSRPRSSKAVAGGEGAAARPDWTTAASLAATGWAGHDAPRPRRRRDGRRDRRDERPGDRRAAARPAGRARRVARSTSTARPAPTPSGSGPASTRRGTCCSARTRRPRSDRAGGRAGPRRAAGGRHRRSRAGPASGPTGSRRSSRPSRRAAGSRPRRGDGGGPGVQAGHPVPRPARRRALLPHAPDAGRRRRPPPRPLVDRRGRPPEPGRRRPAGRASPRMGRGGRRRLRAGLPARRAAQRRHDRRSGRSTSARSTSRTPPAGRSTIRETEKLERRVRRRRQAVAAVADDLETWSRLVFDFLELAPTGPRSDVMR